MVPVEREPSEHWCWLYTNLHSTQHMTLVWSSSINCKRFLYFPYGPSQQWLPVCHNKQPLPSIIYLPDPLSLHRYVWDIFHIQWRFGDGGGHQPVGLNAGIVYNSDPTSRISNLLLFLLLVHRPHLFNWLASYELKTEKKYAHLPKPDRLICSRTCNCAAIRRSCQ